jgi:rhomboid protease GluP
MANCISCGRELPSFSFVERSDVCANCRAVAVDAPGSKPIPPAQSRIDVIKSWPPVTTALVAINAAVFVTMLLGGVSVTEPTTAQLLKWGANFGPRSLGSQPWRLLTSNYVHIGIIHIALNMWCLWNLGLLAENIFDPWTYVLAYTACGLAGSLASLWWHPLVMGAGASGAIFGLAGALIAALYLGRLPISKPAMRGTLKSLLAFAGYNLFFGAVGARIDNSAHIGGLVAGLAVGAALARKLTEPAEVRQRWRFGVFAVTALVLFVLFSSVKQTSGYVVPLERGLDALQNNQPDDAVRNLEQAAAKRPNDHIVQVILGQAYLRKLDYAKAETALQHAVQTQSEDAQAQYFLGFTQLKLGKAEQATATLQKAAQLDPSNPDIEQNLGMAYAARNMRPEAQATFQKANQLRKAANNSR